MLVVSDLELQQWLVGRTGSGGYLLRIGDGLTGPWSRIPGLPHVFAFSKQGPADNSVVWEISYVDVTDSKKGYMCVPDRMTWRACAQD